MNYINQQLAYRDALRGLNFLLNKSDMNRDYQFTDALDSEAEELDYAELANKLESSNIDLKTIYLTQAVLHNNIGIAKADRMPRLSVDLGYGFNRSVQDLRNATSDIPMFEAPDETFTSDRGTYFANFTLAFTLFNGNRINRAIKNAIIQEDIGTIRIERLRSSINRDLADAYDQYNTRLKLYHINKRRVEAASVNLEISKEKFSGGSINSFDYRTVQNNNLIAEIQLLQSLYNLIDSKVVIQRLTGGILDSID